MKKFVFGLIILITLSVGYSAPTVSADDGPYLDQIAKGNELYANKKYDAAARIYESLIAGGIQNGFLYYNLGNAYFRQGKIGFAVLNYLHARKWLPRDEALEANLNYAIQETVDQLDWRQPGLFKTFFFWMDDFNLVEHLRILLIANLVFWLSMVAWWYYRSPAWNMARKVTLVLLITTVLSTGTYYYLLNHSKTGVVLVKSLDIKSATNVDNVTLFKLNEGAVVFIKKKTTDWVEIELADGKKGWAPREFIGY